MKALFNYPTRSVVLYSKGKYYDARNGNEMSIDSKLPQVQPFDKYTLSKPENVDIPDKSVLESLKITLEFKDGKIQFGGNYPRYFWKGFVTLIKNKVI